MAGATWYGNVTGNWNDTAVWGSADDGLGGDGVPADDDTVVIATAVTVTMNIDTSAYAVGIAGVTIRGGATPGMLAFKSDADGTYWLKVKTGTNIVGTTSTNRGRLFMAGGTWGSPSDAANGRKMVIEFAGTSAGKILASDLDIIARCTQPANLFVRTYGTAYTVSSVNDSTDVIDLGTTPPGLGTQVRFKSTGTLPGGLEADRTYVVRTVSGNTHKVAYQNSDSTIVDLTSSGSGTITLYTAHTNTGTATISVFEDVTADAPWTTGSTDGNVVLVSEAATTYDQQRVSLTTINAGSLVLSANVDSTQGPGAKVWLASRNVRILSASTTSSQPIVDFASSTFTGSVLQCEIRNTSGTGTTHNGYGVVGGVSHTISGVISGCNRGTSAGTTNVISAVVLASSIGVVGAGTGNVVSGKIAGCSTGISAPTSNAISGDILGCSTGIGTAVGCMISGLVYGSSTGISGGQYSLISGTVGLCSLGIGSTALGHTFTGTIIGCSNAISGGYGITVSGQILGCVNGLVNCIAFLDGATISKCSTADLNAVYHLIGHRSSLLSSVQNTGYALTTADDWRTNCIYDYGGSTGQVKAWMPGGTVVTEAAPGTPPVTLPYAYKMLGESTTRDVFLDFPLWAKANQTLEIQVYEKCNEDPDNWDAGPRFQLIDPGYVYGHASSLLVDKTAKVDGGDDTDWHTITLTYTPTTDRPLILRSRACDATAYYHWMFSAKGVVPDPSYGLGI